MTVIKKASLLFLITLICIVTAPKYCCAQAVPDTTLNHPFPDTTEDAAMRATDTSQLPPAVAKPKIMVDTTAALAKKKGPFQPNPKKAGLYSAILPGLGQLYDHQYWKIPVIYAGAGIAAYFIGENLKNYQTYRKAYIQSIADPNYLYNGVYGSAQLNTLQGDYEKYLDMSVLFTGLGYVLQVMDAVVYAHLKNFDVSQDISLKVQPVVYPNGAGLGLVVNFK